ncbi:MAG: hypothetical protein ACOC3E_02865 [Cyanobacteriota bacterium]
MKSIIYLTIAKQASASKTPIPIENRLHWVLDVTFNEDASRIRQGHASQNMALLCRLSVSLLKREPAKMSLAMKRYTAALDIIFCIQAFIQRAITLLHNIVSVL